MTPARFLEVRMPAWQQAEDLVAKVKRGDVQALTEEQLLTLSRLYPAIAVDAARVRGYGLDARTQHRVNALAVRMHGLLYRREPRRPLRAIGTFFARDYPRLMRRSWRYVLLSALLLGGSGVAAYAVVRLDPPAAYQLVPGPVDSLDGREGLTDRDISDRFRRIPKPPLATGVMTNNIAVAFQAFALGITAGAGTCYVLLVNGVMLGAMSAHFANSALAYPFWSFVLPHGCLELFAIVIAAAAGLRLGLSLVVPGHLTRKAALRSGAREAVQMVLGTVPMFVVAGAIEGFITPSHLPGPAKIALGVTVLATALVYLAWAGTRSRTASSQPVRGLDAQVPLQ